MTYRIEWLAADGSVQATDTIEHEDPILAERQARARFSRARGILETGGYAEETKGVRCIGPDDRPIELRARKRRRLTR